MESFVFFISLVFFLLCGLASGKDCTNSLPSDLASHTLRANLLSTKNEVWKNQMMAKYQMASTNERLHASKMNSEGQKYDHAKLYGETKNPGDFKLPGDVLKEVSLHDVTLLPNSYHFQGQQTNLQYLLMMDVDRLVWSFRKTAGLPTPGIPYGGWEDKNQELRGHFVGHYLSATAQMWASTHNENVNQKMTAVVSALFQCQKKIGTGYLSAFPTEFFDRLERLVYVWAPYYTIHKILAGLLDQYTLANNGQALNIALGMVEYFNTRVQNLIANSSLERHYQTLNEESGGMNEVLYRLFSITRDPKHLNLAQLFDKPCFLGILAVQADNIAGLHSNTHIPIVTGVQRRYEVTGDEQSKAIGTFFMDIINSSHAYATGGTSEHEFWTDPKRLATTLTTETEESCTTYNMLKVSRYLFKWTKRVAYADYYERSLTNGVLGIQRGTDPGVMIYMLPLAPGSSKPRTYHSWGTPFDTFWCCYGTGIESFSKLGDSIYFEEEGNIPGLYIIQYVSSSINWKSGHIVLNQKVDPVVSWNPYLRLTLQVSSKEEAGQSSSLNFRIPSWTYSDGTSTTLNGQNLSLPSPGNFLSVTKKWSSGDKLSVQLAIGLRTEAIKDDRPEFASIQAILYGPYLLAGHSSGDWDIKAESSKPISDWITPIPDAYNAQLVTFTQESGDSTFILTNSNQSITMEEFPESGTDAALHATFRLILKDESASKFSSFKDAIGKSVMLEPFDFPGMFVVEQGTDNGLVVTDSPEDGSPSVFHLVAGLDGRSETLSLESENRNGCFVYSGVNYKSGTSIKLNCNSESSEAEFNQAASFIMQKGITEYHPISFVAKGVKRNFLLAPLLSFRDESYTVYFNIQA